jgi:uncharacterized membrane protein YkvA (DUF1232 family)
VWALLGAAATFAVYCVFLLWLLALGGREAARALVCFVPDCVVLTRRLMADGRTRRRHRLALGVLVAYLAFPFDLVPDFLPIVGQVDDVILVTYVLRRLFRDAGPELVREHWPGPEATLNVVLRLAFGRST